MKDPRRNWGWNMNNSIELYWKGTMKELRSEWERIGLRRNVELSTRKWKNLLGTGIWAGNWFDENDLENTVLEGTGKELSVKIQIKTFHSICPYQSSFHVSFQLHTSSSLLTLYSPRFLLVFVPDLVPCEFHPRSFFEFKGSLGRFIHIHLLIHILLQAKLSSFHRSIFKSNPFPFRHQEFLALIPQVFLKFLCGSSLVLRTMYKADSSIYKINGYIYGYYKFKLIYLHFRGFAWIYDKWYSKIKSKRWQLFPIFVSKNVKSKNSENSKLWVCVVDGDE